MKREGGAINFFSTLALVPRIIVNCAVLCSSILSTKSDSESFEDEGGPNTLEESGYIDWLGYGIQKQL